MKRDQLISVIAPVYNVEDYIGDGIQSVLGQTYPYLELILVDDGSTDKSGIICDEWKKKDSRITVIHQKNQGVSVARNEGITRAKGEWIAFLDGDDSFPKNALETLHGETICVQGQEPLLRDNLPDIIIGDYYASNGNSSHPEFFFESKKEFKGEDKETIIKDAIIGSPSLATNIGVPWGKLYRKEFIKSNELQFVPGLKRMQDTVFNLYAFEKAENVKYIHAPVYNYVKRDSSSIHKYSPAFKETAMQVVSEIEKFAATDTIVKEWDEILDAKRISLFMEWCRLEPCHRDCDLPTEKCIRMTREGFGEICGNEIKENNYMTGKQKIILSLGTNSHFIILYTLLKMRNAVRKF